MNSWRVFTFRYGVQSPYGDNVLGNRLQEYVTSMGEIDQRALAKWIQWRTIAKKQGKSTLFEKLFQPENTGFVPVRKKEAWNESRGNDTTTLPLTIAATAYVKGVLDHALREGLPITYATEDNTWQFQPRKRIILPTYATRVALDQQAMQHGMEKDTGKVRWSSMLRDFHAEVLAFARQGLQTEAHYLNPFQQIYNTGETPVADDGLLQGVLNRRNKPSAHPA